MVIVIFYEENLKKQTDNLHLFYTFFPLDKNIRNDFYLYTVLILVNKAE